MPLWAVENDLNSHGGGDLIAQNPKTVFCENKNVIHEKNPAGPDALVKGVHSSPAAVNGSANVFVYSQKAHRHNDKRACGASTVVLGQRTVFVN